ncbi:MAG: hypothetical protein RBU21_03600 [FCB group bacterium]|jgi:hypothetical protein|nr:hypothetical protein [FCB group bacterium]
MLRAFRVLWTVGVDVSMAVLFLLVWFRPYALGEQSVRRFAVFYMVEFMAIHATFCWAYIPERTPIRSNRISAFVVTGIMYTIAMGLISMIAGNIWVLVFFWAMLISHFSAVVLRLPGQQDKPYASTHWGIMLGLYIACLVLTMTFIPMPAFGITPEVIAAVRPPGVTVKSVPADEPYRCIAFGVVYCTSLAIWTLIRERTSLRRAGNPQCAGSM